MMFWLKLLLMVAALNGKLSDAKQRAEANSPAAVPVGDAREFKLVTGDVKKGQIEAPNEEGLVLKLDMGSFSERIPWAKFTQETLKRLALDPRTRDYARPFIDIPPEVKAQARAQRQHRRRDFVAKPVPTRVELPAKDVSLMGTITTPFNLAMLGLLFAGNIYAAYEIAAFRNRPAVLVCGVSVILPVIGPLAFLSMPTRSESEGDFGAPVAEPGGSGADHAPAAHGAAAGSLSMAKGEKAGPAKLQPATYTRSDATFDRRFFETKFPGYFRVVLGEAEKEYVLVVKTVRDEYMAQRIARITGREMHLQLLRGGAETSVNFGEITQVQLRHRDASS